MLDLRTEETIRQAWRARDDGRALELLMEAYGTEIYRFCLQSIGHREAAADVHQTVFVQAFRDLRRFRGDSSFRVWLYAIARHRCLDWSKRHHPRAGRELAVERLPENPAPGDGVEQRTWRGEIARALRHCLGELEAKSRTAVLLRFQQGLSYPEIEATSGERAATLQARVTRALPLLRQCLKGCGVTL